MFSKLNSIMIYTLIAFFISFFLYPFYIKVLKYFKAGKTIREESTSWGLATIFNKLHWHKSWTPTMWGWLFLIVASILILFSFVLQKMGILTNSLVTRQETYIILFAFFSMWILWIIDDYLNIKWIGKVKWLTARMKLIWMFLFSWFISYWFYFKLGVNYINFWPFAWHVNLGIFYLIFTFLFTVAIVNAINITDWLDGLAGWLMVIILIVLGIITFSYKWYLATTVIGIIWWSLLAFLWFNINPAKIFMWDSWALALGWLVASLIYLLNIRMWIIIPFMILFFLFWLELLTSFIQIISKKIFKKKFFPMSPLHHRLEYEWYPEHTIVMKMRVINWVLAAITFILIFYQFNIWK